MFSGWSKFKKYIHASSIRDHKVMPTSFHISKAATAVMTVI